MTRTDKPVYEVGTPVNLMATTPTRDFGKEYPGLKEITIYDAEQVYDKTSKCYRWEYTLHGWQPNEDGTRSSRYIYGVHRSAIRVRKGKKS